ncbi:MAG: hypothetical protein A4E73_01337 [Syntrophaceae bacterium PtaU1.Bin231]|nr:MAG: hypothetical protein A4E73_01337 [Syntrophaceae bacterium PtaU1.Bin231]
MTRRCIPMKEYQRRTFSRFFHVSAVASSVARSTVMGWWTVATTGKPMRFSPQRPYERHWLSCTMS